MSFKRLLRERSLPFPLVDIDIQSASDEELVALSQSMGIGMSLDEMITVQKHFEKEGRSPTDIELHSLGQAWSEHCCYKSSRIILEEFLLGIDHPDVIARGDAGVMVFDDDYAYALRIESHNHPSAIEPYGGAGTGIGGIIRDVVCMGAQPIALAGPLCFGHPDHDGELPPGARHPRYLLDGAIAGIRDYANLVGVPALSGGLFFDPRYLGSCLANVGCVGIVPRDEVANNFVGGPGEVMILCGGRTGRDGIHGVTFASAELTEESSDADERPPVQLGDPLTKEPLVQACLEVNRRGLLTGMKDLGGGGLSCVVGEMALDAGCGSEVRLDLVPVKEDGLAPWEIWVSESQERMMLAAKEEDVQEILDIFQSWDILATPVARSVPEARTKVFWGDELIFDMDLKFLTGGPTYCRPHSVEEPEGVGDAVWPELPDREEVLMGMLADLNVCSREWAVGQFDQSVRGATVLGPLAGPANKCGPGDSAVVKPVADRWSGLGISVGCNPWFTALDPYRGGLSSLDEACRNLVASGCRPHSISNCLNFGNPEKPDRLGQLREAVRGLGELAGHLNLPIPSGNVSLYNEGPGGTVLPTPMILGLGRIGDVRKALSSDLKEEGSSIYLVGETLDEMGGSLLFRIFGGSGGQVPGVDFERLSDSMDSLLDCMGKGMVSSCHDCSDGGLALAVAEMCIGGGIGATLELGPLEGRDLDVALFSESNSRWLVEVAAGREADFEARMGGLARRVGVSGGDSLSIPVADLNLAVEDMRTRWSEPLPRAMEG